jgi:hypothetical protein
MKNILIDISIAHNNFGYVSGAGEYALVILKALAARKDINLFISAKSSNSYQEEIKRFSKPENYIATDGMYLLSGSSTQKYWRAGRTYKWFAIWAPEA